MSSSEFESQIQNLEERKQMITERMKGKRLYADAWNIWNGLATGFDEPEDVEDLEPPLTYNEYLILKEGPEIAEYILSLSDEGTIKKHDALVEEVRQNWNSIRGDAGRHKEYSEKAHQLYT